MLPAQYRWLEAEPGARMIAEALKQYGTLEAPGEADHQGIGVQGSLHASQELGVVLPAGEGLL